MVQILPFGFRIDSFNEAPETNKTSYLQHDINYMGMSFAAGHVLSCVDKSSRNLKVTPSNDA